MSPPLIAASARRVFVEPGGRRVQNVRLFNMYVYSLGAAACNRTPSDNQIKLTSCAPRKIFAGLKVAQRLKGSSAGTLTSSVTVLDVVRFALLPVAAQAAFLCMCLARKRSIAS